MEAIFGKDGALGDIHKRFEFRREQLTMADFVLEVFVEKSIGIVEAGTGIGKTLAYLFPASQYCIENGKILAVSTETRALQKQLIDREIPILEKVFAAKGLEFRHSVCLGSSNYVCAKKFSILASRGGISKKDLPIIDTIGRLLNEKVAFSRLDLSVSESIWQKIARESEGCENYKCTHYSACPFQKAKKEWSEANILTMNHYLFFSNIASQKTYLPIIDTVIFDEAHSLEEICADQCGFSVSGKELPELFDDLFNIHTVNKISGIVQTKKYWGKVVKLRETVLQENDVFFRTMMKLCRNRPYTLCRETLSDSAGKLIDALNSLIKITNDISEKLEEETLSFEIDLFRSKLFAISENLKTFAFHSRESYVYWIENEEPGSSSMVVIKARPLDVSEIMKREVNEFYESVLFTSATLSVNGTFNYITERLGIENHKQIILESPFDYKSQACLYITSTSIEPDNPDYAEYIAGEIYNISEIINGNCLVLFTSYKSLNQVKQILTTLTKRNIHAQGEFQTTSVLKNYLEDKGSLLMGTQSFWQGIDLPGDLLRGVIITRLPFSVPDRPQNIARSEKIESLGANSFYTYYIPEAILKFKQGFGRLIRSGADRGVVAVLDSRIAKKSYGSLFIHSIPQCMLARSVEELKKILKTNNDKFIVNTLFSA